MTELSTMAKGGKWLQTPDNRPAVYVVHEEHIKRMQSEEGAREISDPRTPLHGQIQEHTASIEDVLKAEIARLTAELEASHAEKSAHTAPIIVDASAPPAKRKG